MVTGRDISWRRRGAVMVDIIVSVILLGIALAAMIGMAGRAVSAQTTGEHLSAAAALADETLNTVLLKGAEAYPGVSEGVCDPPFQAYRYRLEISGGTGGDAFGVRATILWYERGREQSVVVETMIAPRLGDQPDPDRRPKDPVQRDLL